MAGEKTKSDSDMVIITKEMLAEMITTKREMQADMIIMKKEMPVDIKEMIPG
jgi:hypothetical protein